MVFQRNVLMPYFEVSAGRVAAIVNLPPGHDVVPSACELALTL